MKGIVSSFVLAVVTGRSFALDHTVPVKLENHLVPALIDWLAPDGRSVAASHPAWANLRVVLSNRSSAPAEARRIRITDTLPSRSGADGARWVASWPDDVTLSTNLDLVPWLLTFPPRPDGWSSAGLPSDVAAAADAEAAWIHRAEHFLAGAEAAAAKHAGAPVQLRPSTKTVAAAADAVRTLEAAFGGGDGGSSGETIFKADDAAEDGVIFERARLLERRGVPREVAALVEPFGLGFPPPPLAPVTPATPWALASNVAALGVSAGGIFPVDRKHEADPPGCGLTCIFGCAFGLLFSPSKTTAAAIAAAKAEHPTPYVAVQLRTGGSQIKGWSDPVRIRPEVYPAFWAAAAEEIDRVAAALGVQRVDVFLTSDSEAAAAVGRTAIPALRPSTRVWTSPGYAGHVERGSRTASAFPKTILDHWLIGEAEGGVVSESGYSRTAMWRTRIPLIEIRMNRSRTAYTLDRPKWYVNGGLRVLPAPWIPV